MTLQEYYEKYGRDFDFSEVLGGRCNEEEECITLY